MDAQRFDNLTRALGMRTSRRRLLRGLVAAAVGGLAADRSISEVQAACAPGQVTRRGICVCRATGRPPVEAAACPAGRVACRGCCVEACRGDMVLDPDRCACTCPPGLQECRRQCVDPALYQTDLSNCGGCGNVCKAPPAAEAVCSNGLCDVVCAAGFKPCDGDCIPATACCTAADCPAPTEPCQAAATCTAGACGFAPAQSGAPCRGVTGPCVGIATCDGNASTCPPNPPLPDGMSCGSDGESCQGGICTGPSCLSLGAVCTSSAQCCQDQPTVCGGGFGAQGDERCVHIHGGTCDDTLAPGDQGCGAFFLCNDGGNQCFCSNESGPFEPTACGGLCCLGAPCLDYDNAICGRVPDSGECPGSIFTSCGDACCPPGSTCLDAATSTCSTGCARFCLP